MGLTIVCEIGGTNYGPSQGVIVGNDSFVLDGFEAVTGGPGMIGSCTIHLVRPSGGAYPIVSRQRVKVVEVNDATNVATRVLFDGFVHSDVRWSSANTKAVWWADVQCNDLNILGEWLRVGADQFGLNLTAGTFGDQMLKATRWVTLYAASGSPTVNAVSENALASTTGMSAMSNIKGSLREITDRIVTNLNAVHTNVYPKYYIGSQLSVVAGQYTEGPYMYVYDGAASVLAAAPVAAHFSVNAPTGSTYHIQDYRRTKDGIDLQTRVVAVGQRGNPPSDYQAAALSSAPQRVTYENPFDQRTISTVIQEAWQGPPIGVEANLTTAQIQSEANAALADLENPRETLEITTLDTALTSILRPTQVIQATIDLEGLSGQRDRVAANTVTLLRDVNQPGDYRIAQTLMAGNKLRALDDDQRPGTGRVVERDIIGPEAPTNLAISPVETGKDDFEAWAPPRMRNIRLTWTPSASDDAVLQRIWVKYDTSSIWILTAEIPDNATATHVIQVMPNRTGTIYLHARDGSSNWGGYAAVAFTSNLPEPSDKLFNGSFDLAQPDNPTKAEGWAESNIIGIALPARVTATTAGIAGIDGRYVYGIALGPGATITLTSDPVKVTNPAGSAAIQKVANIASQFIYRTALTDLNIAATVQYRDKGGLSTGTLVVFAAAVATPGVNTLITLTAGALPPINTVYMELVLTFTAVSAGIVYIGACELESALPGTKVSSKFELQSEVDVTGTGVLAVLNTGEANFSNETSPIRFYEDDDTTLAGYLQYSSSLQLTAQGTRSLQLGQTAGRYIIVNTGGINYQSSDDLPHTFLGGPVVLHDQALGTSWTDGFTYLPSMAGTATGTPTAYTGTVPIVVDTTNQRVGLYLGGAWKWLAPGGTTGIYQPLTNGDLVTPELIFADGDVIMVGG
jgi:hypothetical protein